MVVVGKFGCTTKDELLDMAKELAELKGESVSKYLRKSGLKGRLAAEDLTVAAPFDAAACFRIH